MNIFNYFNDFDDYDCISGLTLELRAQYIYHKFQSSNRNIVVVTNGLYEANNLFNSLSNYTNKVVLFPMDDFLTSEALATSPELSVSRLETLHIISGSDEKHILVTNLMGYLRYLPKKEVYVDSSVSIKKNTTFNQEKLVELLFDIGYKKETIVTKTGEIGVRGYVIDIFPIMEDNPIRIEFWGDEIESIKYFDVDTQRTIHEIDNITIYPISEFLAPNTPFELRKQKYLKNFSSVCNISSYLDDNITIFSDYNLILSGYDELLSSIKNYSREIEEDIKTNYMFSFDEIKNKNIIYLMPFDDKIEKTNSINVNSYEVDNFVGKIENINKRLNNYLKNNKTVIICVSSRYQVNKIDDQLNNKNIVITDENNIVLNKINVIKKNINEGYEVSNFVVISEQEIFNRKKNLSFKTKFKIGSRISDINKLKPGDYVVHATYGIGRYVGLDTLEKNGIKKDYLKVEYQGKDKLYIPVEKIELISKYSSNDGLQPRLNKLGSSEWAKTKLRVKKKIEDMTTELMELYAKRENAEGFAFPKDDELQIEFENEFGYSPTADQLKVCEEIKKDMESKHPMDRLLCGDVGFGKTEVSFRAIFKAISGGKQVALLCPTTILSNQHYNNAIDRFKNFPVRIALLNRFVTPSKVKEVLSELEAGKIDLLIGTHRILSDDVKFKDLGLLVIDEEQRFGVKHKEKIKMLKENVDVLTLSATPIPRTLQMSMSGLRSLSLIETPPVNRYPIQTYVTNENNEIIRDAIYKELSRNGQVFILFNSIVNMREEEAKIKKLVPNAKIVTAHGKMDKDELEDVMLKFINNEYNVLICTTIIETGIDIPNVNTLIIYDADRFGLSQLYQIRGRVGRSDRIAYCYLLYNNRKVLTDVATKRLNSIKEFTELGSGFSIAMRDLAIRGAGDILGKEQAGFVDSVGVELFLTMLNEEMEKLKGNVEPEVEERNMPLIDVETSIDSSYVNEDDLRIEIHKKINTINSIDDINRIKEELEDRFGIVSENMIIYMYEEWFEKLAKELNITKVNQTRNYIEVIVDKELTSRIDGELLFDNLTSISRMFRFKSRINSLVIILDTVKLEKHFIYYLIDMLNAIKNSLKN